MKTAPHLITFDQRPDERGNLTIIEGFDWPVQRAFLAHDIPPNARRGQHAHKTLQQIIVAAAGSFSVQTFDGTDTRTFQLNVPHTGLLIPPLVWVDIDHFSPDAVMLVLTDQAYDEDDYIRDMDEFLALLKANQSR